MKFKRHTVYFTTVITYVWQKQELDEVAITNTHTRTSIATKTSNKPTYAWPLIPYIHVRVLDCNTYSSGLLSITYDLNTGITLIYQLAM